MSSIFFSYARADARAMVERLRDAVIGAGHAAWLDVEEIGGGADWAAAIENAIDHCDVTVALLTAGSYRSEICRAEQMRTLRRHKRLIPVLIDSTADRPLFLEHLNYRDFSSEALFEPSLRQLLVDLAAPDGKAEIPKALERTPVYIPVPLEAIVSRPAQLDEIRRAVLGEDGPRDVALTAVRGMGGVGKTTLAAMLCKDDLVAAAFPDGIFWITVGRDAGDLAAKIADIGVQLSDTRDRYTTVNAAAARLTKLLHRRSVLLVLDDVWDAEAVRPLLLNLPQCRTLITTRDGSISAFLRAREVRIGSMEPEQSNELLRLWSGRDDPRLAEIAERLGHLPLALRIVAANLHDTTPEEWLRRFQRLSQVRTNRYAATPEQNLELAIDLSVDRLRESDRLLYIALGVFPDDVRVPLRTVTRFWRHLDPHLTAEECEEIAVHFARRELLEIRGDGIEMHDVLRLYVRGKLGAGEAEMHRRFLQSYNTGDRLWSTVEDDGYLHGMLLMHMDRAGDRAAAIAVLLETEEYENAWYEARRRSSGLSGYLQDVHTVAQWAAAAHNLELAIFCALCECSVASIALELAPAVVERLVVLHQWDVPRAVEHVRQITKEMDRAEILHRIAPHAKDDAEHRRLLMDALIALDTVDGFLESELREAILEDLCRAGAIDEVLDWIRHRDGARKQREALIAIASWIREPPLRDAALAMLPASDAYSRLDVARALIDAGSPPTADLLEYAFDHADRTVGMTRGKAYGALLTLVKDPEQLARLIPRAFAAAEDMPDMHATAEQLGKMAPAFVTAGAWHDLVRFTEETRMFPEWTANVIVPLAHCLPAEIGHPMLDELLASTRAFEWPEKIAESLIVIASAETDERARGDLSREALVAASTIDDDYARGRVLRRIAGIMPAELAPAMLDAAFTVDHDESRTNLIAIIIESNPAPELVHRALEDTLAREPGTWTVDLLIRLIGSIEPAERNDFVERAGQWCASAKYESDRLDLELRFLPFLTEDEKIELSNRALDGMPAHKTASILRALAAPDQPEHTRNQLATLAFESDLPMRRGILSSLAPSLDAAQLRVILDRSGLIGDYDEYRGTLQGLRRARFAEGELPDEELLRIGLALAESYANVPVGATAEIARLLVHRGAVDDAATLALALGEKPKIRAYRSAMSVIAPRLSPRKIAEAIASVETVKHEDVRFLLLLPLLPYAEPALLRRTIDAYRHKPRAIAHLIPLMDDATRNAWIPKALDDVLLGKDFWSGYSALEAILPWLDRDVIENAWNRLNDERPLEDNHREALMLLSSRLGTDALADALQTSAMLDKPNRARMLARASRSFGDDAARQKVLQYAVNSAEALVERDLRADSLMACAFAAEGAQRDDLITRAFISAAEEDSRALRRELLDALGPFLWHDHAATASMIERILPILAARPRGEFLEDLGALRYSLHLACGSRRVEKAITQVRDWWN